MRKRKVLSDYFLSIYYFDNNVNNVLNLGTKIVKLLLTKL